ncbi:MAG: hypothetical protein ACJAS4_003889 [Bacteriovoracaceae bacterium]|jgi:hypothetical protein
MLIIMSMVAILFSSIEAKADFKIETGLYMGSNCFLKISKEDELVHIQFAHKDQHLLREADSIEPLEGFDHNSVLGTNVFYDLKDRSVVFGPDKCGQGRVQKVRSHPQKSSWDISCGGNFSEAKVKLKLFTNKKQRLIKFKFIERFNNQHRGRFSWPWRKKTLYNFTCKGLKYERAILQESR